MTTLTPADKRALNAVEREAKKVLRQIEFFRAGGDDIRWLFISGHADQLAFQAHRGVRRYQKGYAARKLESGENPRP